MGASTHFVYELWFPQENEHPMRIRFIIALMLVYKSTLIASAAELPDLNSVAPDLVAPAMVEAAPGAGKRVRCVAEAYRGTGVYHSLYLPVVWEAGRSYPVIVEYAGNGPYGNEYGDVCTGKVEDCKLGYGISGGEGFIWLCLPYVSEDHRHNQLEWWGDVEATANYCKKAVANVCEVYGGNSDAVFVAGFSRGSIACNFIGLHDDEIASLWCGFICHGHYDGVKEWDYPEVKGNSAATRLGRLGGRPQFISHEGSVDATREYLRKAGATGEFTFQALPYRNHTDSWVLRDIVERQALRAWVAGVLENQSSSE